MKKITDKENLCLGPNGQHGYFPYNGNLYKIDPNTPPYCFNTGCKAYGNSLVRIGNNLYGVKITKDFSGEITKCQLYYITINNDTYTVHLIKQQFKCLYGELKFGNINGSTIYGVGIEDPNFYNSSACLFSYNVKANEISYLYQTCNNTLSKPVFCNNYLYFSYKDLIDNRNCFGRIKLFQSEPTYVKVNVLSDPHLVLYNGALYGIAEIGKTLKLFTIDKNENINFFFAFPSKKYSFTCKNTKLVICSNKIYGVVDAVNKDIEHTFLFECNLPQPGNIRIPSPQQI